jgi:activator of HSP90 ATPase
MLDRLTRREFSASLASLLGLRVGVITMGGGEVTRASEAIHQEVVFNGSRTRVYEALTDAKQFTTMTTFSLVKNAPPAQISPDVGGAFSLFGGHIVGRHVELVPGQRLVQAWRVVDWEPGIYSIAKFELKPQGAKTMLVFDHTGFPNGLGQHLAEGWEANYWTPLRKFLG